MAIPHLSTWMTLPRFAANGEVQEFVEHEAANFGPYSAPRTVADIREGARLLFGDRAAASVKITMH